MHWHWPSDCRWMSRCGVRRLFPLGNKRKLGLIQALMHRPALLILDEPTTGLDPLVQQIFYDLMQEIRD